MNDYLAHHGVRGQRWGIRRYQNLDGSLTDLGQRRRDSESPSQSATTDNSSFSVSSSAISSAAKNIWSGMSTVNSSAASLTAGKMAVDGVLSSPTSKFTFSKNFTITQKAIQEALASKRSAEAAKKTAKKTEEKKEEETKTEEPAAKTSKKKTGSKKKSPSKKKTTKTTASKSNASTTEKTTRSRSHGSTTAEDLEISKIDTGKNVVEDLLKRYRV